MGKVRQKVLTRQKGVRGKELELRQGHLHGARSGGCLGPALSGGVLSWKYIFWQRVDRFAGWSVSILLFPCASALLGSPVQGNDKYWAFVERDLVLLKK